MLNGSREEVRSWITRHLDPLEDADDAARPITSDFDLNPTHLAPDETLKPAAVLVALVEREEGLGVLLTRRSDTLRRHTGQVAFPGGRCDPGETVWQTALREAQEEIGLDRSFVTPIGYLDLYMTTLGYRIVPVIARVAPGFALTLNESEVDAVFEVPLGFLMDQNNVERHSRDWQGMTRHYYAITFGERYIWGVTAGILRNLHDRIYR